MHGFISNAIWILGLRLAGVPLQFLLFTLIAWRYPLAQVGIYALFNTAWFLARQLGPLGMEQSSLRFIPALRAANREDQARWFECRARQIVLLLLVLVSAILGLLIFLFEIPLATGVTGGQFAVGLAALPGYALVALMAAQCRARGRIQAGQWPDSNLIPIAAMIVIQAAHAAGQTSLFWLLAAHTVAVWSAVAAYWLMSRRYLSGALAPLSAAQIRDYRAVSLTIALGGGINVLANRLPLIFVSAIIGTPAAALYEAAQRVAALATLGTWAASTAVSPLLSDAHARKQKDRLQDLLIASSWTALLPAMIIFLALLPWGGPLLGLFGPDYPAAHGALVALVGFAAINASAGLTGSAFYMTGHEAVVLRFNSAQLLTILVLAPLLIHLAGILGAGLSVLISGIVRDVGMGFLLPGKLGLMPGVWSRRGARRALGFVLAMASRR